jgi:IclR family transcriptional regulator, acetate operon repressor
MKNKPTYSVESVDHALHLAVLLQQEGPLRVVEAAERLGVARSTAHRLLTMLVYRDFAEQGPDRRYRSGPVLRRFEDVEPTVRLKNLATPFLRELMEKTGETANLMVLNGRHVRFIGTVECDHVLRVGDREGRLLPAHLASGGRALLARLSEDQLDLLYSGDDADRADEHFVDRPSLRRALRQVRKQGFALNNQATETGVTAIGYAVEGVDNTSLSLALPTARFSRAALPGYVSALRTTAQQIERQFLLSSNGLAG